MSTEPRTAAGWQVVEATASDPFIPEEEKPALREAAIRAVVAVETEAALLDVPRLARVLAVFWHTNRPLLPRGADTHDPAVWMSDAEIIATAYENDEENSR